MRQFEDVFKRFLIRAFVVVCFVAIGSVSVANAAGEEVKIPVIVNILRGADGNNVGAAIKKANKILENAHIKLVVEKTNNDVNVGDKNQDLTFDEGDEAQKKGQTELGGTFTDPNGKWNGKGVKITVGGDCWVGEPNTIGWSKHRNPVLVVEGGAEPNSLGGTIAHELFHILTVKKHSADPNNLMYPTDTGGEKIEPNDVNEIFPEAKKRGTAYTVQPEPVSSGTVAPAKIVYSIDAYGAVLDGFYDMQINPPVYEPNDPTIQYADMREVSMFADSPFGGPGSTWRFEIHRGGLIPSNPVQSQSNFVIMVELDPLFPGPDLQIEIQLVNMAGQAFVHNLHIPSNPVVTLPVMIHLNERFDGTSPLPVNHSLEVDIPIEILPMSLTSAQPITVTFGAVMTQDNRPGHPITQLIDPVAPFKVRLSGCPSTSVDLHEVDGMRSIKGCEFDPNTVQNYFIDGTLGGSVKTDDFGCFYTTLGAITGLSAGLHTIDVIAQNDTSPTGAKSAAAFFSYCPQGHAVADMDGDCDVDLMDFAELAANWLHGK